MIEPGIEYHHDRELDPIDVARVFTSSGIIRPVGDLDRVGQMFSPPSLVVSAWRDNRLVGVARSLTDYAYACYLSDLAVDKEFQGRGIGAQLVEKTRDIIGEQVSLVLLSAPGAMSYYSTIGFDSADNAFVIKRRA